MQWAVAQSEVGRQTLMWLVSFLGQEEVVALLSKLQFPKARRPQDPQAGWGEDTFSPLSFTPLFLPNIIISVNSGYLEL